MSGTGNEAVDVQRMISLDTSALGGRRCGCHGHGAEACCCCGAPSQPLPWVGPSEQAVEDRGKHLKKLVPAVKALLSAAQEALADGATTSAEIRDMQRLEVWLGRLLVEEEMHRKPPKKR